MVMIKKFYECMQSAMRVFHKFLESQTEGKTGIRGKDTWKILCTIRLIKKTDLRFSLFKIIPDVVSLTDLKVTLSKGTACTVLKGLWMDIFFASLLNQISTF